MVCRRENFIIFAESQFVVHAWVSKKLVEVKVSPPVLAKILKQT
jgi:hypothetical protein